MKDNYPKQTRKEKEPNLVDGTEKDPQGWTLEPVPNAETQYIDMMDERGVWDSVIAGMSMGKLQKRLQPGTRLVIVGREASGKSSFIRLTKDVTSEVREYRGELPSAQEQGPGLVATFSDMPTPDELQEFLAKNSTEAGYMQGWSHNGEVPYMALYGDTPGAVEFGTMNAQSQTRTQAGRDYHDGSYR